MSTVKSVEQAPHDLQGKYSQKESCSLLLLCSHLSRQSLLGNCARLLEREFNHTDLQED